MLGPHRVDFEEYGFETDTSALGTSLTYGPDADLGDFAMRNTVLFGIYNEHETSIEFTVTPTLLDMPVDPPFLFAISTRKEVRNLLDAHRVVADQLQFPHQRIAQYLALRYLNRRTGEKLDRHDIGFLTNTDLAYQQKIQVLFAA